MKYIRLFKCVLVLATFASQNAPEIFGQEGLPRLEPAKCFIELGDWIHGANIECKWLVVSEGRANPKSRAIKLATVIVRATEPDGRPPLVMLHGGPGDSGIRSFTRPVVQFLQWNAHRDVVVYDQRGAGFSEPKLCPEYQQSEDAAAKAKTPRDTELILKKGARACVASLRAQGVDPAAYNTSESAKDLIELRHLLGYPNWDILSGSYGARLAQEAMLRDPTGIRSVVLESPVTLGRLFSAEVELSFQRALERVFTDCAAQPDCKAAFPVFEADFYAVYDELKKTPLQIPMKRADGGGESYQIDSRRFVNLVHNAITKQITLTYLPFLLNELRRGDKTRAAQTLVEYDSGEAHPLGALPYFVFCFDDYGTDFFAARKSVLAQVRRPFSTGVLNDITNPDTGYPANCRLWQSTYADPSEHEAVRSDIPTLLLTGRYDDRTPTEHAKHIASNLSKVYLFEFPNEGHGARPVGCHLSIIEQFWRDPTRQPDGTCISSIARIQFVTSWKQISQTSR